MGIYLETLGFVSPFAIHLDCDIDAWQEVIQALHKSGAKIAMQIGNVGRQESPEVRDSAPSVPYAIPIKDRNSALRDDFA